MKAKLLLTAIATIAAFGWLGASTASLADVNSNGTELVQVPIAELLSPPKGFDDNDNIQIVLHGELKNSCYSLASTELERISDTNRIRVRQFAFRSTLGICAEPAKLPDSHRFAVPYTIEASVGQLNVGDYKFEYQVDDSENFTVRSVNVARASEPTVDSKPYAAITAVIAADLIARDEDIVVTLRGILVNSCTELKEDLDWELIDNVYVIRPQILLKAEVLCTRVLRPFEKTLNLGKPGVSRHYLVHVRSMNGSAMNRVVQVTR